MADSDQISEPVSVLVLELVPKSFILAHLKTPSTTDVVAQAAPTTGLCRRFAGTVNLAIDPPANAPNRKNVNQLSRCGKSYLKEVGKHPVGLRGVGGFSPKLPTLPRAASIDSIRNCARCGQPTKHPEYLSEHAIDDTRLAEANQSPSTLKYP